jgi:ribonucleoside-diphosphate reductase alpha chain
VRNRHLQMLLAEKGRDTPEVWSSITLKAGSVQHLDFLTEQERAVFKTAFELDQRQQERRVRPGTPIAAQTYVIYSGLPRFFSRTRSKRRMICRRAD